jgi:hypothetical protein
MSSAVLVQIKGLRMAVPDVDVVANGALQLQGTAMGTAAKLFIREVSKEALDLVYPGSAPGSEV